MSDYQQLPAERDDRWYSGDRSPGYNFNKKKERKQIERKKEENEAEDDEVVDNRLHYEDNDTSWQARAYRALQIHKRVKEGLWKRQTWTKCLRFPDPEYEKAFQWYFGELRAGRMQGGLLILNFVYMIFALVAWGSQEWDETFPARMVYASCLVFGFAGTFTHYFKQNLQGYSSALSILTGMEIIVEAALRKQIYHPATVMILLVYLMFGTIVVGLQMSQAATISFTIAGVYDFVALVGFSKGDSYANSYEVGAQLAVSNVIIISVIAINIVISRRLEIARRQEFLTSFRVEKERRVTHANGPGPLEALLRDIDYQPDLGLDEKMLNKDEISETKVEPEDNLLFDVNLFDKKDTPEETKKLEQKESKILDSPVSGKDAGNKKIRKEKHKKENKKSHSFSHSVSHSQVSSPTEPIEMGLDIEDKDNKEKQHVTFHDLPEESGVGVTTGTPQKSGSSNEDKKGSGSKKSSPSTPVTSPRSPTGDDTTFQSPSFAQGLEKLLTQPGDQILALLKKLESVTSHNDQHNFSKLVSDSGAATLRDFLNKEEENEEEEQKEIFELSTSDQLPPYFAEYPYVLSGYRVNFSPSLALDSLLQMHNETFNIWTEFVPFLVFMFGALYYFTTSKTYNQASNTDKLVVAIGVIGAVVLRPLCSGLAHAFFCSSRRAYVFWWGVDYVSICVSILCGSIVFGRFSFYCVGQQQVFYYFSVIGLFLSTILSVLFVASHGVRAGAFCLFVVFANAMPFIYQFYLKLEGNPDNDVDSTYFTYWILSFSLLAGGLLIKSTMLPERCKPGHFDIYGYSHQWWHCFINAGHVSMIWTWSVYLTWRQNVKCSNSI